MEVLELIPKRDSKLSAETVRQQTNERLRVQFAQMANQVGEWIKQRTSKMRDIGMNARGSLENQLHELNALNDEINGFKEHILELDALNAVIILNSFSFFFIFILVGNAFHLEIIYFLILFF